MNTQTLTDLTLQTLHNYETAATQAVAAYRAGSQRVVQLVNGTLEERVYPRAAKLAPRATARIDALRGNVHGFVVKGVDSAAERTTAVIERGSEAAAARLAQVAGYATEHGNPIVVNGLDAAARITLPVAQLALTVSGKVAEGATALATAAGAHPVKKVLHKTVKAAAQKTRAAAKGASKGAGQAVKAARRRAAV